MTETKTMTIEEFHLLFEKTKNATIEITERNKHMEEEFRKLFDGNDWTEEQLCKIIQ